MSSPVRVKICGITNEEDARIALDAGADALGFNLYPGSKRHVPLAAILPWLPSLGTGALRVAVMVNPELDEISRARPYFDVIQLHGQESAALCTEAFASGATWKAFPLTPALDSEAIAPYHAHAILIDSSVPGQFGGTGVKIDLDQAARFTQSSLQRPVWLSGGLDPENVAEAISRVRPFGVDVASGVERSGDPRRKDATRLHAFVGAARSVVYS